MKDTIMTPEERCPLCDGVGSRVGAMSVARKYDWVHADWDADDMIDKAQVLDCPGCLGTGHIADTLRRKFEHRIEWCPVGSLDDDAFRKMSMSLREEYNKKNPQAKK